MSSTFTRNFIFRVNHRDEILTLSEKHDLKVISIDNEKLQIGCSIKQLSLTHLSILIIIKLVKNTKLKLIKLIMDVFVL